MKVTLDKQQFRLNESENALTFQNKQMEEIQNKLIPDLEKKLTEMTEKVCFNLLDLDQHRRKWNFILNGITGTSGEHECDTRDKVKCFAKEKLEVTGVDSVQLAACHRLAQKNDAGIIARFVDLGDRNKWLSSAKNLKNKNTNVSISPDMPPVLRPLKDDILKIRKELPPDDKRTSQVKYLPNWPYVC